MLSHCNLPRLDYARPVGGCTQQLPGCSENGLCLSGFSLYSTASKTGIREGGDGYFRCCWSQTSKLGRQGRGREQGFTKSKILSCFCRHERKPKPEVVLVLTLQNENMMTELLPNPIPSRLCSSLALDRHPAIPPSYPGRQRQQEAGGRFLPRWALMLACSSQPAGGQGGCLGCT